LGKKVKKGRVPNKRTQVEVFWFLTRNRFQGGGRASLYPDMFIGSVYRAIKRSVPRICLGIEISPYFPINLRV